MNAGEFANLQCTVPSGDLPLTIRWRFPGVEIGGASGVLEKKVADRVSMLMISAITARHAGEYTCSAENAAGLASHTTLLTVNGSRIISLAVVLFVFVTVTCSFFVIYFSLVIFFFQSSYSYYQVVRIASSPWLDQQRRNTSQNYCTLIVFSLVLRDNIKIGNKKKFS